MAKYLTLHFLKPGLFTTVQDQGRFGYQAFGVPTSGALDRGAAEMANQIVGNPPDSPVLEITLLGPKIQFQGEGEIALTGADLSARLNGQPCASNQLLRIKDADLLQFGRPLEGCRAYLSVRGQWQISTWLSSRSAITQNGAKLSPQSLISKGTSIQIETAAKSVSKSLDIEAKRASTSSEVRVLPGPEFERFSRFSIGEFFGQSYQITPDSNRMGYRLKEKLRSFSPEEELISTGIIPGTIQITTAGQPIILLADAQTSGGYYRIANVLSEDLDLLAQFKPGDRLRFTLVSFKDLE